jgi:hypothetical protein
MVEIPWIQCTSGTGTDADGYLDTCPTKRLKPSAGYAGVRVFHRGNHFGHTGGQNRFGARRCSSVMSTRFQCHEERRAPGRRSCFVEGENFRMRMPGTGVATRADDLAIAGDHHCPDPRVGMGSVIPGSR